MSKSSTASIASSPNGEEETNLQGIVRPFKEIPGPKGVYNLPHIGFLFHLKPFSKYTARTLHLLMDDMIEKYGNTFLLRTNRPSVIITDPKDYAKLIRQEGKYPSMPLIDIFETYHKRTRVPRSVFTLQGPDWWRLRQPIQQIFLRPKKLACYLPFMNVVVDDFIEMLSTGYLSNHDVNKAFMNFMAESVGTAFFGKRLGFLDAIQNSDKNELQQSTHALFDILQKTLSGESYSFKFYRSKDYIKFESGFNCIRSQMSKMVKEEKANMAARQNLEFDNAEKTSILRSLLEKTNEQDTNLIMETLFPAAIDSSAAALQVILHTIAAHPYEQEKLRQQVCDVLDQDPGTVVGNNGNFLLTQEHIDKMPYLKAIVKEVFRYQPVSIFTSSRTLAEDVTLGGYKIPAGIPIMYMGTRAAHDATVFEDPDKFVPERWLRMNKTESLYDSTDTRRQGNSSLEKEISWAVHPFGIGSRSCPGKRMFEQEAYLFLTKLLYKYEVGLKPESLYPDIEYKIFARFVKPPKFTFTPRNRTIASL